MIPVAILFRRHATVSPPPPPPLLPPLTAAPLISALCSEHSACAEWRECAVECHVGWEAVCEGESGR
eukprot:927976-Rhodomonas_salina.3